MTLKPYLTYTLCGLLGAFVMTASGASITTADFEIDTENWVDRDASEMLLSHAASGHPGGSLQGVFAAQGIPALETDAFRADLGSSSGDFTGVYDNDVARWVFDFYSEDVAPSEATVRFSDGSSTFFKNFLTQVPAVSVWQSVSININSSSGWFGGSEASFNTALRVTGIQWVEIQLSRNGTAAQTYFLDSFQNATVEIPVPEASSMLMMSNGFCLLMAVRWFMNKRRREERELTFRKTA